MRKSLFFVACLAVTPAASHDWYPMECCSGMDCAPVEKVEILQAPAIAAFMPPSTASPIGGMLVTTVHGSVVVPANFPRRTSKDSRMHACMRPGPAGTMRLICIFLPPAM